MDAIVCCPVCDRQERDKTETKRNKRENRDAFESTTAVKDETKTKDNVVVVVAAAVAVKRATARKRNMRAGEAGKEGEPERKDGGA